MICINYKSFEENYKRKFDDRIARITSFKRIPSVDNLLRTGLVHSLVGASYHMEVRSQSWRCFHNGQNRLEKLRLLSISNIWRSHYYVVYVLHQVGRRCFRELLLSELGLLTDGGRSHHSLVDFCVLSRCMHGRVIRYRFQPDDRCDIIRISLSLLRVSPVACKPSVLWMDDVTRWCNQILLSQVATRWRIWRTRIKRNRLWRETSWLISERIRLLTMLSLTYYIASS